ncbi:MAG: 2-dehydropantoate 2-reductase [Burkholderiaceae bacterium]
MNSNPLNPTFQKIAVVGAGAVGSYFGAMLARAGHAVTLIARAAHVQAIERDGLRLEMASKVETIRISASSDLAAVQSADLVLFCVKSTDSESVAQQIAPYLAPQALILSLQNGVDNAAVIARQVPHAVIPAVVYVATAMTAPGSVTHHGRGDLVIGTIQPPRLRHPDQTLRQLVNFFATAQVPVRISDNVMAELWAKLLVNCAYNAISGLSQLHYGKLAELAEIRTLQAAVVREVIAVASADGVTLSEPGSMQAVTQIAVAMAGQKSSTAQDMARHKPSEIDHLNGFIVRRGLELGIPTPVNQTLHALVKLVETSYLASV